MVPDAADPHDDATEPAASTRDRVLATIRDDPGATAAHVARTLDVHYSTARHHLDRLAETGEVDRQRTGTGIRHFPAEAEYDPVQKAVLVADRSPTRRQLLAALAKAPSSVSRLADRLDCCVATVSDHLARLRKAGLVRCERAGRRVVYELAEGADRARHQVG